MKIIPLIFTFDFNLSFPAGVCLSSLLMSAGEETFYDIFVLHSGAQPPIDGIEKIRAAYANFRLQYRSVGNAFDDGFEIRGITKAAYYRLLAADLIPEYDKAIYADTDILFRFDQSKIFEIDLSGNYIGAVYAGGFTQSPEGRKYLQSLNLDPDRYFVSGYLLMDLKKMREDKLGAKFIAEAAGKKYIYQDQDILNIVCKDRIMALPRSASMGVSDFLTVVTGDKSLPGPHYNTSDDEALNESNVHYNGQKPWKDLCPNFDIWWECYRKSPLYNPEFYFKFYYNKLEPLERLSLMKRVKVLVRYFVYGRKKDI